MYMYVYINMYMCTNTNMSHNMYMQIHANAMDSHVKTHVSTAQYRSGVPRPFGSHENTSQSYVKTRANTIQDCLDLLEAM